MSKNMSTPSTTLDHHDFPEDHPHDETEKPHHMSTETIVGMFLLVLAVIIVVAIIVALYFSWRSKKTEATQTLQLTKLSQTAKSQLPVSMLIFERAAWAQYLQLLQQKELEQLTPFPALHELLKDQVNTLDYVKLKREAARLIAIDTNTAWRRGLKAIKNEKKVLVDYLIRIRDVDAEAKDEAEGHLKIIKGCRFEKIPIKKDTQVLLKHSAPFEPDCLHMSKLRDYYGFPLILCQAPKRAQFDAHWQAIWQEMVGTIVWIGGLIEERERKIDEYIPMIEGGKTTCGKFQIRTVLAAKVRGGYNAYRVQLTKGTCPSRELVFVHVHMWPDHDIPEQPGNLADLVWQIQGHQLRQNEKDLSCVMMHCSLGVQRSPALMVAYIGRQMWMVNKKVNVLGILRYVRRHRWKAFSMGNPFAQVQIIFGVLQVIATRSQMEGIIPLQSDAQEREIFDHSLRRKDAKGNKSLTINLNP